MLVNKMKKLILVLLVALFAVNTFAETQDLATRFLNRANEAYEDGNIEDAYKYVNQALAVSKDEAMKANVIYFAQSVYAQKLQGILENFDDLAFIDIQTNIEKYPTIENTKIKKLVKQIVSEQERKIKDAEKADAMNQRRIEQQRYESQKNLMDEQTKAMKEQADALKEQAEATKLSQAEVKDAIKDIGAAFNESAQETKKSTKVIALSIIAIAIIILLVIFLIMVIVRKGIQQSQVQQEQYVQAFKMLAATQTQTNRIMLGGVTDLYGNNAQLRLAGASTWAPAQALPDVEFSEEEQEEIKQLAVKCEEIGKKIDMISNRKNNSKNVSELVYKLSIQLGLPQGVAMLNFCAAMIYDAGFLSLDPDLLMSETLTDEQKEQMKKHVLLAEKHLDFVPKKYWDLFSDAAIKHHENIDGTGYPKGLKGDDIPQIARLIRVAESYVSLSSKRNYRQPMDKESAINLLSEQQHLYDITVVQTLEQIV